MPPGDVRTPVCPVCSRIIPPGTGLAFMRRDNLIHQTCLTEAQRRAEPPRPPPSTSILLTARGDDR